MQRTFRYELFTVEAGSEYEGRVYDDKGICVMQVLGPKVHNLNAVAVALREEGILQAGDCLVEG